MQPAAQQALEAARDYLREHPEEFGRAFRSAIGLRLGVPLVALRYAAKQAEKSGKIRDIKIDAVPPGLKVSASLEPAKTPIRFSVVVYVDRVVFTEEEMTVALRVEDIQVKMDGDAKTPLAAIIKSGAINLTNVGSLVGYLPDRPPVIADARDNRITLDFMRDPKIGLNPVVRKVVGLLTGFVTLDSVRSDSGHLDVGFRALPTGVRGAADAFKRNAILPLLGKRLRA